MTPSSDAKVDAMSFLIYLSYECMTFIVRANSKSPAGAFFGPVLALVEQASAKRSLNAGDLSVFKSYFYELVYPQFFLFPVNNLKGKAKSIFYHPSWQTYYNDCFAIGLSMSELEMR